MNDVAEETGGPVEGRNLVPHYAKVGMASFGGGGSLPALQSLQDVVSIAQLMARAGVAVPAHLRENPGACLAVTMQALRWEFDPFAVANKSYSVNDRLAYEAQLINAVVLTRAPVKGEPDYEYEGEGLTRKCTISFDMVSGKRLSYTTPEIGKIKVKNSPLWTGDPDQQLGYFAVRSWARRHTPQVILGVYDREEIINGEVITEEARPVGLVDRLPGNNGGTGFDKSHVEAETAGAPRRRKKTATDSTPEVVDAEVVDGAPERPTSQEVATATGGALDAGAEPDTSGRATDASTDGLAASDSGQSQEAEDDEDDEVIDPEPDDEAESLPPEFEKFIDAVEAASTWQAVKAAMSEFWGTDLFKTMARDVQNRTRANVWATCLESSQAGKLKLPDHADDVTAFRLWIEAQDDKDAIDGTLKVLERSDSWGAASESLHSAIYKAVKERLEG